MNFSFKTSSHLFLLTPQINTHNSLTDTSLTEEINEDGNDVTIMTFTKLLSEDNEIPIVTNGTNIFLHARGIGQSSLSPHAGYGNVFEKDFSEDVTEVSMFVSIMLMVFVQYSSPSLSISSFITTQIHLIINRLQQVYQHFHQGQSFDTFVRKIKHHLTEMSIVHGLKRMDMLTLSHVMINVVARIRHVLVHSVLLKHPHYHPQFQKNPLLLRCQLQVILLHHHHHQ